MVEVCELEYNDVPTYILQGVKKQKKIYISYNAIYAGLHHSVRKKIIDTIKVYLSTKLREVPLFKSKIHLTLEYRSKRKTWDLDNKCGLWCKVFLDSIKGVKIKDDNVQWVESIGYKYSYTDSEKDTLIIKIYQ